MSYEGQLHHPHDRGYPPSPQLLLNSQSTIPPNFTLLQAHWFVRHGERAPVRQRMVGLGEIPAVFELCSVARNFTSVVTTLAPLPSSSSSSLQPAPPSPNPFISSTRHTTLHSSSSSTTTHKPHFPVSPTTRQMPVQRFTEDLPDSTSSKPTKGGPTSCYWGELTDLGRQSTLRFGSILRSLYVDSPQKNTPFLPSSLDPSTVQFRSTNMPRTIESLHQVIEGLYPGVEQGVEFRVRNWMDENLYPNTACKRLRALDAVSIQNAAKTHNPSLATLDEVLRPVLRGIMKSEGGLRIDSSPRANGVLDTLMVCRAHGIKVPKVFERRDVLEVLERGVVHEWFDGYLSPEFRRLAMGRLFSDIHSHLSSKIDNPSTDPLKLLVNSCHDTSLGGILNTLDAFDGRWPPFTSNIGIELYKQDSSSPTSSSSSSISSKLSSILPSSTNKSKHFVRVLYNGRELELPACQKEGNHLEGSEGRICTFEAFEGVLKKWGMSQGEWEKECGE